MALKIVKSARHYTETALDEIDLLKKVHISVCKPAVKQGIMEGGEVSSVSCRLVPKLNPLTRKGSGVT